MREVEDADEEAGRALGDAALVDAVKALPAAYQLFLQEERDSDFGRSVQAAALLGGWDEAALLAALDREREARGLGAQDFECMRLRAWARETTA